MDDNSVPKKGIRHPTQAGIGRRIFFRAGQELVLQTDPVDVIRLGPAFGAPLKYPCAKPDY